MGVRKNKKTSLVVHLFVFETLMCASILCFNERLSIEIEKAKQRYLDAQINPHDYKYIVWSLEAGLGNKVLSSASAFLLSVVMKRVFILDWADASELFDSPITFFQASRFKKRRKIPSPSFTMNVYCKSCAGFRDIMCSKMDQFLKYRTILVKFDDYFAPALFTNVEMRRILDELTPDGDIGEELVKQLFRPVPDLEESVSAFAKNQGAFDEGVTFVGTHMRVYECGYFHVEKEVLSSHFDCFLEAIEKINSKKIVIYLSTVESQMVQPYLDFVKSIAKEKNVEVSVIPPPLKDKEQRSLRGSLFEILLLSKADYLFTTPVSTFGYLSVIFSKPSTKVFRSGGTAMSQYQGCIRYVNREPCTTSYHIEGHKNNLFGLCENGQRRLSPPMKQHRSYAEC